MSNFRRCTGASAPCFAHPYRAGSGSYVEGKMKKTILAMTVASAIAAAGSAGAAGLPRGPPPYYAPPPASIYKSARLYARPHPGYGWGHVTKIHLEPNRH